MAAKRETSLLENWVDAKPPTVSVAASATPRNPVLDLGIEGLTDLELVSVSPTVGVYRAIQPALQRTVAIKVLHDEADSSAAKRFDTECRVTSQLTGHAGIVPLLAAGTTGGGTPYLMMPFYRRGSMARLMVEHGPLTWRESAFLVESVAVTMSEVHGRGLIHGNLTPANVMLTDFLLPRVGDFATSGPIDAAAGPAAPAADVRALGAMLWSLLQGAPAQRAPEDDPAAVAAVKAPEAVMALIDRTMADDPARRPATAAAFVTDLRRAAQTGPNTGPVATIGSPGVGNRLADGGTRSTDASGDAVAPQAGGLVGSPSPDGGTGPWVSAPAGASSGVDVDAAGTGADTVATEPPAATAAVDRSDGLAPSAEARYILALVACIAIAVLVMVLAAVLAVS
ncbi:MAG: protein kinase [Actinomycetota bacterium]